MFQQKLLLWKSLSVYATMVVSDWVWARAVGSISVGHAAVAASWSTLYAILSAILVISIIEDKKLLIPYAAGAWVGTYLGT